jgi:hypothetical protein
MDKTTCSMRDRTLRDAAVATSSDSPVAALREAASCFSRANICRPMRTGVDGLLSRAPPLCDVVIARRAEVFPSNGHVVACASVLANYMSVFAQACIISQSKVDAKVWPAAACPVSQRCVESQVTQALPKNACVSLTSKLAVHGACSVTITAAAASALEHFAYCSQLATECCAVRHVHGRCNLARRGRSLVRPHSSHNSMFGETRELGGHTSCNAGDTGRVMLPARWRCAGERCQTFVQSHQAAEPVRPRGAKRSASRLLRP